MIQALRSSWFAGRVLTRDLLVLILQLVASHEKERRVPTNIVTHTFSLCYQQKLISRRKGCSKKISPEKVHHLSLRVVINFSNTV